MLTDLTDRTDNKSNRHSGMSPVDHFEWQSLSTAPRQVPEFQAACLANIYLFFQIRERVFFPQFTWIKPTEREHVNTFQV